MLSLYRSGSGPDLVLVHGWGMHAGVWGEFAGELSNDFRLSLLDLPGHGGSGFDPTARTLNDWAAACLDAAPPYAIWVGWSLGALVGVQAALTEPRRVAALILMGGTPRFVQGPDWPCATAAETLLQFRNDLASDPGGTLGRFLALQVRGAVGATATLRTLRRSLVGVSAPQPQALDAGLDLLQNTDLRHRLADLAVPSLWLLGERDTLVPPSLADRLPDYLRSGRVRLIRGAGHAPFLSGPQEVLHRIRQFLLETKAP